MKRRTSLSILSGAGLLAFGGLGIGLVLGYSTEEGRSFGERTSDLVSSIVPMDTLCGGDISLATKELTRPGQSVPFSNGARITASETITQPIVADLKIPSGQAFVASVEGKVVQRLTTVTANEDGSTTLNLVPMTTTEVITSTYISRSGAVSNRLRPGYSFDFYMENGTVSTEVLTDSVKIALTCSGKER